MSESSSGDMRTDGYRYNLDKYKTGAAFAGNERTEHEAQARYRKENRLLSQAGWFPWGPDVWIHEDDLGTVTTTAEALAEVLGAEAS